MADRGNIAKVTCVSDAHPDGIGSIHPGTEKIVWTFADGATNEIVIGDLSDTIREQAVLFAVRQIGQNSYAGSKTKAAETGVDPVEWAQEQLAEKLSNIVNGVWAAEREKGAPRVTQLFAAMERAANELGRDYDDAGIRARATDDTPVILPDGKETTAGAQYRAGCMANAVVKKHLDNIKAEAAAVRAAASAEAAEGADIDDLF
jgi:hypothetical protein